MIDRIIIEEIFCNKVEYVQDRSKVVSSISFCDPVLDLRYDRIILRDSYETCIIEVQGAKKGYINLRVKKNGIAVELSLITYVFEYVDSNLLYHKNNYLDGVPYFNFKQINVPDVAHYKLDNCNLEFLKYYNSVVIKIFRCDLKTLYWIKTDHIFYGLQCNRLVAVVYDIPEKEKEYFQTILLKTE